MYHTFKNEHIKRSYFTSYFNAGCGITVSWGGLNSCIHARPCWNKYIGFLKNIDCNYNKLPTEPPRLYTHIYFISFFVLGFSWWETLVSKHIFQRGPYACCMCSNTSISSTINNRPLTCLSCWFVCILVLFRLICDVIKQNELKLTSIWF